MTSQLADKIIAYRRELQNPELSNEFATTARLIRAFACCRWR